MAVLNFPHQGVVINGVRYFPRKSLTHVLEDKSVYEVVAEDGSSLIAKLVLLEEDRGTGIKGMSSFDRETFLSQRWGPDPHPNVHFPLATAEQDGIGYVLTRYLAEDLESVLLREGPFTPRQTLHVLQQIANALTFLHGKGISVRDVKLDNMLVQLDGVQRGQVIREMILLKETIVKLFDMGLAIHPDMHFLREGTDFYGNEDYAAPEMILRNAEQMENPHLMDMYSLGICAYYLLTQISPFKNINVQTVIALSLRDLFPMFILYNDTILPFSLKKVISTAVSYCPLDRYQTPQEFVNAFAAEIPKEK